MNDGMRTTPLIPSYTRGIGYQAGLLGGMAMLVGILLMLGEHGTRDAIKARIAEDRSAMLSQVLPPRCATTIRCRRSPPWKAIRSAATPACFWPPGMGR